MWLYTQAYPHMDTATTGCPSRALAIRLAQESIADDYRQVGEAGETSFTKLKVILQEIKLIKK